MLVSIFAPQANLIHYWGCNTDTQAKHSNKHGPAIKLIYVKLILLLYIRKHCIPVYQEELSSNRAKISLQVVLVRAQIITFPS